jgi:DNA-binding MarR family transcriptional regulator
MMAGMTKQARDAVDNHVARWSDYWSDNPNFVPGVEGALVRMNHIVKRMRREDAAAFADSDFTLEDYKTLHALMVQPFPTEATPAQLADATNVTRAAMTSRLDRLAKAGLITREVEPQDRRRVMIRPTAAGRAAWDQHVHAGLGRDRHLLGALSPAELEQLNGLLRKVVLSLGD